MLQPLHKVNGIWILFSNLWNCYPYSICNTPVRMSWVSYPHAYVIKLLSCELETHSACKITLCVWKPYFACRNQSCACWNHTRACWSHIWACRNHTACRNYTLHVGITLVSVIFTRIRLQVTLVCVGSTICVYNHTLRVEITLVRLESHSCVLKSDSCVS
jgi:hypothetical protein